MTAEKAIVFGQFELRPAQRQLWLGGRPVRLGSRALDILLVLVERRGEVVSNDELVARVWPNTHVEPNNLRVHLTALRKALSADPTQAQVIANVPGRGYSFVGTVSGLREPDEAPPARRRVGNLPVLLARVVGREDTVDSLAEQCLAHRLVTIVGPGGIGKSTVALQVAAALEPAFPDGIAHLDIASAPDPSYVASLLAAAVDRPAVSDDVLADLIGHLAGRRTLIVLDGCEHLIDELAPFAERLLRGAAAIGILATSREPLRIQGEWVFRLPALPVPPGSGETAEALGRFPSVQLFVQAAGATLGGFRLDDDTAGPVAEICRRLDGMPLAIELAAARADSMSMPALAASLTNAFHVLTRGRRTALPRHQTLRATMDWSYVLLPERERRLLRALSVIAGPFDLDLVRAVGHVDGDQPFEVEDDLGNLVSKSLVVADSASGLPYRLLDTTRSYAREKLRGAGEEQAVCRMHADHVREVFERAREEWDSHPSSAWVDRNRRHLGNLREALAWAASPTGDTSMLLALAAAAVPLWFELSLIDECVNQVTRALAVSLEVEPENKRRQMQLYAVLGFPQMRGINGFPSGSRAWSACLALAEELGDVDYQLRAMWALWVDRTHHVEHRSALDLADRFAKAASTQADGADLLLSERMRARSLHFLGDQPGALAHIGLMMSRYTPSSERAHMARFQYDQMITARITLTRALWVTGLVDQALSETARNIEDALRLGHVLTLTHALADGACPVALHAGEYALADQYVAMLHDYTRDHALDVWHTYAEAFRGEILIRTGTPDRGVPMMRDAMERLAKGGFFLFRSIFSAAMAEGLCMLGRPAEARDLVLRTMTAGEAGGDAWASAELLRLGADALLAHRGAQALVTAEHELKQAIDLARRQSALSWELRASISLARLDLARGRPGDAVERLEALAARFTEGLDRRDLRSARELLEQARRSG